MVTPTKRLTLFLPVRLHEMVEQAAQRDFSKPSEFARRILAQHVASATSRGDGRTSGAVNREGVSK